MCHMFSGIAGKLHTFSVDHFEVGVYAPSFWELSTYPSDIMVLMNFDFCLLPPLLGGDIDGVY